MLLIDFFSKLHSHGFLSRFLDLHLSLGFLRFYTVLFHYFIILSYIDINDYNALKIVIMKNYENMLDITVC